MAIIAIVRRYDTWGMEPTAELKKFIPENLATFEGSAGYGGTEVYDVVQAAKDWMIENGATNDSEGDHILVIDTQSPEWSKHHMNTLHPKYLESDDYRLSWAS